MRQNVGVDLFDDEVVRYGETKDTEMSLQSQLDIKRTRFWVQTRTEVQIDQFIVLFEALSIVNNSIVDDLSDQSNRRLSVVLIHIRHIDVSKSSVR